MKWLINKAFLMPSVEQLLRRQADSWTSKTIPGKPKKGIYKRTSPLVKRPYRPLWSAPTACVRGEIGWKKLKIFHNLFNNKFF